MMNDRSLGLGGVLFERSHKGHFVLLCLEATMTHLGAGIDELELDLFKGLPLGVNKEGLSQSEYTLLTSTRHSVLDTTGMPGSDTSDLAETFMGLARQLFGMPTRSDTLESFTLGNTNDVDHFILAKDTFDWHFLFKVFTSKVDFVGN